MTDPPLAAQGARPGMRGAEALSTLLRDMPGRRFVNFIVSVHDSWAWRFGVGLGCLVLGLALHVAVFGAMGSHSPFVTFFPMVAIAASIGGLDVGIVFIGASLAAGWLLFVGHAGLLHAVDPWDNLRAAAFVLLSAAECLIGAWLNNSVRRLRRVLEACTDIIADSEAARLALGASEARLRGVIDTATDAIIVASGDSRIVSANRAALGMFGFAREADMLGQDLATLMPPADAARHAGYVAEHRSTGKSAVIGVPGRALLARRRDGTDFPIELSVSSFIADGALFLTGVVRDVTRRRANERKLLASEANLRRLNETLETAIEARTREVREAAEARHTAEVRLAQGQKLQAVGQLTGGVAHDFNNLLTVVLANADAMKHAAARAADTVAERRAGQILSAAERGARLIAQLLAFSRQQSLQPQSIAVGALLVGITDLLAQAAGEAITLQLDSGQPAQTCRADPGQLEAAILNLVLNARDAIRPDTGSITIGFGAATLAAGSLHGIEVKGGDYVRIDVIDSGHGMAPEILARVFDPFFTTKGVGSGSGLGLAQVHGFMAQSAGAVAIASAPGIGTTVSLFLPRGEPTPAPLRQLTAVPPAVASGAGRTILLVEDEPLVLEAVREMLEHAGYRVLVAQDAAQARPILASGDPISVLLTDVVLPGGVSGVELAHEARRLRPGARVLLTSGYAGTALPRRDLEAGGFDLLAKPYPREELLRRLGEMLT